MEIPAARWMTYIVLLSFKFLTEVKLLSLKSHQPLPQLARLLPTHKTNTGHNEIFETSVHNRRETLAKRCYTWVCPHSGDQHLEPSCGRPRSSSSSPSRSVSCLLFCSHSVSVRNRRCISKVAEFSGVWNRQVHVLNSSFSTTGWMEGNTN